jgi:hypothetical protein
MTILVALYSKSSQNQKFLFIKLSCALEYIKHI